MDHVVAKKSRGYYCPPQEAESQALSKQVHAFAKHAKTTGIMRESYDHDLHEKLESNACNASVLEPHMI